VGDAHAFGQLDRFGQLLPLIVSCVTIIIIIIVVIVDFFRGVTTRAAAGFGAPPALKSRALGRR
jgi:hypothetical protein